MRKYQRYARLQNGDVVHFFLLRSRSNPISKPQPSAAANMVSSSGKLVVTKDGGVRKSTATFQIQGVILNIIYLNCVYRHL